MDLKELMAKLTPKQFKQFVEAQKQANKEALKEWASELLQKLGLWSILAIGVAIIYGLIYFLLWSNGWTHVGAK